MPQRWGRPLHVWLLIASCIALVGLLLPWYSGQALGTVSWQTRGFEFSDGTRTTWMVPVGNAKLFGGGNGLNMFTFLLTAGLGGLGFRFRDGDWPNWAKYTLLGITGLVVFIGLVNLVYDPHIGPLLFGAAGGLALAAALPLVRRSA